MKNLHLVCLCLFCASLTMLHAQNGIQLISQSYNISASWSEALLWSPDPNTFPTPEEPYPLGDWSAGYSSYPMTGGYNVSTSDGSPVSASTAAPSPVNVGWYGIPLTASASIGLFSVQNWAFAYEYDIWNPAPIGGFCEFVGPTSIQTSVQGDWLFQPTGNSLDVSISADWNEMWVDEVGNMTVTLTDLTDSTTLLNRGEVNGNGFTSYDTFAVNPSDDYEFNISAWSDTFNNDLVNQSITASITSVPEPGECLLLSLGLAGLLGFRSKFGT